MTADEKRELTAIRQALTQVETDLPKKLELTPEGAAKLHAILNIAIWLSNGGKAAKWLITGSMTIMGAILMFDKLLIWAGWKP